MISSQADGPLGSLRILILLLSTWLLSGCISVFPTSDPVQLYRFDATVPQTQETTHAGSAFNVLLGRSGFDRAAAGDRILTVSGAQAAYISGARWVTSADDLFNSSLQQAFNANQGPARLIPSGNIAHADYMLKLHVHTFEAQYRHGQDTAPEIVVAVQATLTRANDRVVVADRHFKASITADENRVGSIVQAFDQAVSLVLENLVNWVGAQGPLPMTSSPE